MSGELAGRLGERVTVLHRSTARDDLGGPVAGWAEGGTYRAAIAPLPAGAGAGDVPFGVARWTAVLRAGAAVGPGDRLRWRGRLLGVTAVAADPALPDRLTLRLEAAE